MNSLTVFSYLEKVFPGDMVLPKVLTRVQSQVTDNPFEALPRLPFDRGNVERGREETGHR